MKKLLPILLLSAVLSGCCNGNGAGPAGCLPPVWPDYIDVTVPSCIAPLDFCVEGALATDVTARGAHEQLHVRRRGETVVFPFQKWNKMLSGAEGTDILVEVRAKFGDGWKEFDSFAIHVSADEIDRYVDYRLIAPGYEIWSKLGIYERDLTCWRQRTLIENTQFEGCVNCHAYNRTDPSFLSLHIRGKHGATIIRKDSKMTAFNTATDSTLASCVYPYWHPDGRYIIYSTNKTVQTFHINHSRLIEVFDTDSDLQVYDTQTGFLTSPESIRQKDKWESFPVFGADGRSIFFTRAEAMPMPIEPRKIHYDLCRVSFDPETGEVGDEVEVLIDAASQGRSISFPRPSYDGRFLMYTLHDYGNFSIWHPEADLWLLDLETMESRPLEGVNSPDQTDSFHNWSRNSRWFVFSSRREDGTVTRAYICHIDPEGNCGKPFLLPQKFPGKYYMDEMRSVNVPDFASAPADYDDIEMARLINSPARSNFIFKSTGQ